jgi:hypothetical protein
MKWKAELEEKKLDALFVLFDGVSDEELKAHLAKFLCIRTSGLVETTLKNLIIEYIDKSSPVPVQKFVIEKIQNITNLKYTKLHGALCSFKDAWGSKFEALTTDAQREALNAVVSNRNKIAHGEPDNISFEVLKTYYLSIKEVISHLKGIVKK